MPSFGARSEGIVDAAESMHAPFHNLEHLLTTPLSGVRELCGNDLVDGVQRIPRVEP